MWVPDIVIIFLCVTSITSKICRNNTTRLAGGEGSVILMTLPPLRGVAFRDHDTPLLTPPLTLVRSSGRAAAPGLTPLRLPRAPPFEEWIEKGHQRDANLCGAYARP